MPAPLVVELAIDQVQAHRVVGFEVERQLGRPARATVLARMQGYLDPAALVGLPASLRYGHGAFEQGFDGLVASVASVATPSQGSEAQWCLRLEVVSLLGLLEHSASSCIFQDQSVPDIVKAVLADHGIDAGKQIWKLSASYPPRTYCVQYAESALDFVNRLLEKEGIFYSSRWADDGEILVFEDDSASCDPLEGDSRLEYVTSSGMSQAGEVLHTLSETHRVASGKVVLRDYDFERPDLDLTTESVADSDDDLELYDYPGGYVEPAEGSRYARVQLEAEQADRRVIEAQSNCARLGEGRRLTLADAPRGLDGDYVVTRVSHQYSAVSDDDEPGVRLLRVHPSGGGLAFGPGGKADGESPGGDAARTLGVSVTLLPIDVPFRRRATTETPVIDGPQTATVVAPEGSPPEEIHTDEHGRCKVKFHWDRAEALDDRASCWIRTQQLQTSGSMILPRVDWEVIVEFQQGDPDRPIITGRLFNGRYMPPYELPAGKTRSTLQSSTSPGGAGTNEIRFEDAAGKEEISIKAEKNQKLATGSNKNKSTGNNETQSVAADRTLNVGANQTIKVSSGYQNTVAGAQTQSISGSRKVGVNAVLGLSTPSMTGTVGGNQFEMDGNPLAGLIDLAADMAADAAKEMAADAMKQLDAAVKEQVDKVMGPIDKLQSTLDNVQKGMDAAKNGDLSGAADAAREAAGLPTPGEFASDLGKQALGSVPGGGAAAEGLGMGGASGGGRGGGEGGGGGGHGAGGGGGHGAGGGGGDTMGKQPGGGQGRGGGEGGGGGGSPIDTAVDFGHEVQSKGISAATGLDQAVNKGIDSAINKGAGGLKDALGVGKSGKNFPGPPGGVSGNAAADNACGPGHSVHQVGAAFTENIGAMRVSLAAGSISTNAGATRTQNIGGARIELVNGVRAEACGDKTETAAGLVVICAGTEAEKVGGDKSTNVGGAILSKVGGDAKIASGGPAAFVGALHKVDASSKITFNCGASSVIIDGGGITIKSPSVNVVGGSVKMTKTVDQGPGGGAGGGGGAGPGGASGGSGGGAGAGGGSGGGGGGGGASGGTGQDKGKDKARGGGADQSSKKEPPPGPMNGTKPTDEERKLAGAPGNSKAQREARKKVAEYGVSNQTRAYYEKDEKGKETGAVNERNLSPEEQGAALKSIDYSQPVEVHDKTAIVHHTNRDGELVASHAGSHHGENGKQPIPDMPPEDLGNEEDQQNRAGYEQGGTG